MVGTSRRRRTSGFLVAGVAIALACSAGTARGPSPAPAAAPPPAVSGAPPPQAVEDKVPLNTPIHLQTLRNLADAALFIANDLGFFDDRGVVVAWESVRSG